MLIDKYGERKVTVISTITAGAQALAILFMYLARKPTKPTTNLTTTV